MVNQKRAIISIMDILAIAIFIITFLPNVYSAAEDDCFIKDYPSQECPFATYEDGQYCCYPTNTVCTINADCDDNDPCTLDGCFYVVDSTETYCQHYSKCPPDETCTAISSTDYTCSGGTLSYCGLDEYQGDWQSCGGSWTETTPSSCDGYWYECESEDSGGMYSFFTLITGKVTSFITGKPILEPECPYGTEAVFKSCSGPTTSYACTSQNAACSFTSGGTTTTYCSNLYSTQSTCESDSRCYNIYECLPKIENCNSCTSNEQCLSRNCNDGTCFPFGETIEDGSCATLGDCSSCSNNWECISGNCDNVANLCVPAGETAEGDRSCATLDGLRDLCQYDWQCINPSKTCKNDTYHSEKICDTPHAPGCFWLDYRSSTSAASATVQDGSMTCGDYDDRIICNGGTWEPAENNCFNETFSLICEESITGEWWELEQCQYGCDDTTGDCAIPTPKIIWENAQGTPITTIDLGQTTPLGSVNIVFENYDYSGLTDTTFIIKEKDDFSEGSIDDNVLSINGESDGNGNLIATWEITSANVDSSINTWDNEPDGQLEFYVTLNSYQADLTANIQSGYCGDGTCDINSENCTICEEDCGICLPLGCTDEVQNGEETGIDCGGTECPSCEKAPYWTTENMPYELIDETETSIMTVEDIVDGTHTFRMVLQNPVDTGATFELREDDFLGSDLIQDNIPGTLDSNGHLETFWTPTMADFLNAGGGNDYEFYFNVDTETSTNLVINVDTSGDDFPTCNDGIMNGDEEGEDCGGSCEEIDETKVCPPPVCFNVQTCGSYLDQTTCEIDECNVSEKSSPDLGENETASCIWIDASDKCDVEESSYYGDVKIGSCVYDEDTSTDNCDDGFLSYSWDAYFDWGENSYTTEALCEAAVDDECKEIEGFWHYDPADYRSSCQAGSQTIPCPAQIQLNFFTWKNFFAAALLILIVYIILKNSNTVKKASKKKINSKKKVKKKKISKKKK